MDSVIGNTWMYLCLICAVLLWIVYHKLVHVYYVDLFRGICKEIFFSLFFGILLGTAIMKYPAVAVVFVGIIVLYLYSKRRKRTDDIRMQTEYSRMSNATAQKNAEPENNYRVDKFTFYSEVQAQSLVEPFQTNIGERIKIANTKYLKNVFSQMDVITSNPPLEIESLENVKNYIGRFLSGKELVYMILPDEKIVLADKGIITKNTNHGRPAEFLHYKQYVYLGQDFVTMASERHAEALCNFFRYVYLNEEAPENNESLVYTQVLAKLQSLPQEVATADEHFSTQKEYEKYVKMVKAKVLEKLKKDDPETYQQYLKKQSNKKEDFDNWQLRVGIGAIVVFVIKIFLSGLFSGIIPAIVVLIVGGIIGNHLEKKKYGETLKALPDFIRKVEEEDKKENIKKTGNVRVDEYEKILQSSFGVEYETWNEPNQSSDENVLNDDFDPERDAEIKKERTILTVILIVVCIIAIRL